MTTVTELKAQLFDELFALEVTKAVIISPAGTAHDSASGKFTSKPGGGKGGKGSSPGTHGGMSWDPKDPTDGGNFGSKKLKTEASKDPLEFDAFGSRGRGKTLGVEVSGLQSKGGLQLKVGGKSMAEHRASGTLDKAVFSVRKLIGDYNAIAAQTTSSSPEGKLLDKPRPRGEAYRSSIYRDILSQMVKPYG